VYTVASTGLGHICDETKIYFFSFGYILDQITGWSVHLLLSHSECFEGSIC
jgi:hypothetical protein